LYFRNKIGEENVRYLKQFSSAVCILCSVDVSCVDLDISIVSFCVVLVEIGAKIPVQDNSIITNVPSSDKNMNQRKRVSFENVKLTNKILSLKLHT
jgi:hypothetical protein